MTIAYYEIKECLLQKNNTKYNFLPTDNRVYVDENITYRPVRKMYLAKEKLRYNLLFHVDFGNNYYSIKLDQFPVLIDKPWIDPRLGDPRVRLAVVMGKNAFDDNGNITNNGFKYKQTIGMISNSDQIVNTDIGSSYENPYNDTRSDTFDDILETINFSSWFTMPGPYGPEFPGHNNNKKYARDQAFLSIDNAQFPLYFGVQVNHCGYGLGFAQRYHLASSWPTNKPFYETNLIDYSYIVSAFGSYGDLSVYPRQQISSLIGHLQAPGQLPATIEFLLNYITRTRIINFIDNRNEQLYFIIDGNHSIYTITSISDNDRDDADLWKNNIVTWSDNGIPTNIDSQEVFIKLLRVDYDPETHTFKTTQGNYEFFTA